MKIALAMITKTLDTDEHLCKFIDNAAKYGHNLDCAIVAYSHRLDHSAAENISKKIPFISLNVTAPDFCTEEFRRRDISEKTTKTLLHCPVDTKTQEIVPYGYNRTVVLLEALLRGVEVLIFVDSDVFPSVLMNTPNGPQTEEVDFFGAHIKHLNAGFQVTTCEYSGYNILPPAVFDGMQNLLGGLNKADMTEYWQSSKDHNCLITQPAGSLGQRSKCSDFEGVRSELCTKILGGNVAIKLSAFSQLPPFFSTYYTVGKELFLGRGEDTILSAAIAEKGIRCAKTGIYPMHDTYKNYPARPDLRCDPATQERFFYACTGWIGRNPFLSHIESADSQSVRTQQREMLVQGSRALARYTSNPRFLCLEENFDISWDNLERYIYEYENILEAWEEFRKKGGVF